MIKKKNTKTKLAFRALLMLLLIGFAMGGSINTQAANCKRAEKNKNYAFAVPEGGWSSCLVNAKYEEHFSSTGNKSNFFKRVWWYTATCSFATSKPKFRIVRIRHMKSNGTDIKCFTDWSHEDGLFPGGVTYAGTAKNTTMASYPINTSNIGALEYVVDCDGAIGSLRVDSVRMNLNTK